MKKLFKMVAMLTAALAICSAAVAQEPAKPKKEKLTPEQVAQVQAREIAYTLGLDDKTCEKFIQTFCAYRMEIREASKAKKAVNKGVDRNNMTEAQVEAGIKAQFAHTRKVVDIREKYYAEYRKFLNPRQIERVYELEKKQADKIKRQQQQRKAKAKQNKQKK